MKLNKIGLILITIIGATLIGLYGIKDTKIINEKYFLYFAYIGIVVILIGIILIILHYINQILSKFFYNEISYYYRNAKFDELIYVENLATYFFGNEHAGINSFQEWHSQNNETFILIFKRIKKFYKISEEVVGLISILPLNKKTCQYLSEEKISGLQIGKDNIVRNFNNSSCIYIAGVLAKGLQAKAFTLGVLFSKIEHYKKNISTIYTRPTTEDGLRLVKSYNFIPVETEELKINHICYIKST